MSQVARLRRIVASVAANPSRCQLLARPETARERTHDFGIEALGSELTRHREDAPEILGPLIVKSVLLGRLDPQSERLIVRERLGDNREQQ